MAIRIRTSRVTAAWIVVVALTIGATIWQSPAHRRRERDDANPQGIVSSRTDRDGLAQTIAAMELRLRRQPDDERAAVALADALLRQTRVTGNAGLALRAEEVLRRVVADEAAGDAAHYDAHRMLAAVYLSQHRFRDAIREADRCRAVRPNDAWTAGVLGDAHIELGDYDAAFAAFDRMSALRPDAASYARTSYARELQGDLDGALRLMTMAAEATPPLDAESVAWHHAQIGHLNLELGRVDAARRAFEHAAFVFPGHPLAVDGLAQVELAAGRREAALRLVQQRIAAAPSPADLALAGELLDALGHRDEAERDYKLAEAAWRSDVPEPAKLARFLAEHHRTIDAAVRLAEQASADRDDIFTNDALAWAYFNHGRLADARRAIGRALRTGTRDRDIRRHAAAIAVASDRMATR